MDVPGARPGPDIAVVVPVFNRAALVGRALDSVFAQTLPAAEVIVVDDGSRDGTAAAVAAAYPSVRLLRRPHEGVSAARNAGILAATSTWIAFLDSDDCWAPGKLARQAAALAGAPGHVACHCDETWIRNGVRVNPARRHAKPGGWIYPHCLPRCCVSPSCLLIARRTLIEAGLFDESLPACEDYDLWLRLFSRVPVLFVAERLVTRYGGHPDQLSRRYRAMDRFRVESLARMLAAGELGPDETAATRRTLCRKLAILSAGAGRRGRARERERYLALARHWECGTC